MGKAYNDDELDALMKNIDLNNNGIIDYSGIFFLMKIVANSLEFVSATIQRMNLLSQNKLEAAFKLFDSVRLWLEKNINKNRIKMVI